MIMSVSGAHGCLNPPLLSNECSENVPEMMRKEKAPGTKVFAQAGLTSACTVVNEAGRVDRMSDTRRLQQVFYSEFVTLSSRRTRTTLEIHPCGIWNNRPFPLRDTHSVSQLSKNSRRHLFLNERFHFERTVIKPEHFSFYYISTILLLFIILFFTY